INKAVQKISKWFCFNISVFVRFFVPRVDYIQFGGKHGIGKTTCFIIIGIVKLNTDVFINKIPSFFILFISISFGNQYW
ncbi:hypothetical protein EBH72_33385, partial [Klebsiella michiganensis]